MSIPIIDLLVLIVAVLLMLTKALDAFSTARRIKHIGQEANPLARLLMERLGVRRAIWVVFVVSCGIIMLSVILIYHWMDHPWNKLIFIVLGILLSFVQAAVALSNEKGKSNPITRFLLKWIKKKG